MSSTTTNQTIASKHWVYPSYTDKAYNIQRLKVHEPPITTNMLRLPILFILLAATAINLTKDKSWLKQQLAKFALISKMSSSGRRPITLPEMKHIKNQSLLTLLILLLGDIEANPGSQTEAS